MNRRLTLGAGALFALAVLFVGLTVLAGNLLRGARLDLTQNRLYTLAPGTVRIVTGLREPVNLYFFFSTEGADRLPALKTYGLRVREFLEELAARSGGALRLKVIDPQSFSGDEDRAAELGVPGTPLGRGGEQLYFGLAGTNATDGHAAIPFFDPTREEFLEYDVARLVYQLANPKKPVIGWLSSLPMGAGFDPASGQMREPWAILSQAGQLFTVRNLGPDITKIDDDVAVLVLVHAKALAPAAQFAIDQYALRGGRLLVFVDPLAEQDSSGADPSNPMAELAANHSSELGALLTAWGVEFDPGKVIGDLGHALTVSMRAGAAPVRHLGILGLDASALNRSDVVTSGLSSVNLATAGELRPARGAHTKFEPLLESSTEAAPIPVARFQMLMDPSTLRDGFRPDGQRHVFAARITGEVASAFPNGPPAGVAAGRNVLKASSKPLNLIVFADTDLLADYLWVRQQNFFGQRVAQAWAGNGDLVLNALDNLAGSGDLISVRGRASFSRPFERVEALRRVAEDRFRAKEQELESQLRTTEEKLTQLQSARNEDSALILTPEQTQAIERFQQEKLRIRKELREVRHDLDQDITTLGNRLKLMNIAIAPAAFALIALLIAAWRARRRRLAAAAAPRKTTGSTP